MQDIMHDKKMPLASSRE
jgi:hypothetical protein